MTDEILATSEPPRRSRLAVAWLAFARDRAALVSLIFNIGEENWKRSKR